MLTLDIVIINPFFRMDVMVFLWLTMLCVQSSIKIAIYILNAEILFGMYEKGMFFKVFLMYEDTLLKFLEYITHHILVDSTRYLLDKLTDGLQVTGMLAAVRKHPEPFADILCRKESTLDAEMVDLMFEVHLSEKDSNVRQHQVRAARLETICKIVQVFFMYLYFYVYG